MSKIEDLKEAIRSRTRLTALSFLFLVGTTFVSVFSMYLPNWLWPDKYAVSVIDLGSAILGSFMGQVTLLVAMSIISRMFKKKDVEDLPDNEGP
jgi:hypothetical protein